MILDFVLDTRITFDLLTMHCQVIIFLISQQTALCETFYNKCCMSSLKVHSLPNFIHISKIPHFRQKDFSHSCFRASIYIQDVPSSIGNQCTIFLCKTIHIITIKTAQDKIKTLPIAKVLVIIENLYINKFILFNRTCHWPLKYLKYSEINY